MDNDFIFAELEKREGVNIDAAFTPRKEYYHISIPASELNYLISILMTADYTVYVAKYDSKRDRVTIRVFRRSDPIYHVDTWQNEEMYYQIRKACGFIG